MILKARVILSLDGPPLREGAVAVDDNGIVAVGPARDVERLDEGPVLDLGEMVLLPGVINAHCPLDYTSLRHTLSRPQSFTALVPPINGRQRNLTRGD